MGGHELHPGGHQGGGPSSGEARLLTVRRLPTLCTGGPGRRRGPGDQLGPPGCREAT